MRYTYKEITIRVLEKLGTVLGDRRFWIATIILVSFLLYGDQVFTDEQINQYVDAILVVVSLVTLVVGWSIREPSGIKRSDEQVVIVKLDEINTLPKEIIDVIKEQFKQHSLDV